mmetsp:Transcript_24726/g.69418  ORF Transcript_24726/g.69418 Transcript_24726/m.69418 type:complete len:356 (+) Transcript_24726:108-1175(+)
MLISHVVSALPGVPSRMIGTVDVDGNGTPHKLHQVDPFILLDQATVPKDAKPDFGMHPHRGHSVVTLLFKGTVRSKDSLHDENEEIIFSGPASCLVEAGSGLFHDESSVVNDESDYSQRMALLQLWIGVKEADRKAPPAIHLDTELPVEDIYAFVGRDDDDDNKEPKQDSSTAGNVNADTKREPIGFVRYYLGDKTSIASRNPITVAYVHQHAGTTYRYPAIDPSHGGFIINLNGSEMLDEDVKGHESSSPSFAGVQPQKTHDVLVLKNTDDDDDDKDKDEQQYIEITTSAKSCGNYLICTGERIEEPWAKKLVRSGAIIAQTEDEAREIARKVDAAAESNMDPFKTPVTTTTTK